MENIQILGNGIYLPNKEVSNKELAEKFAITEEAIHQKTGIKMRYRKERETIEEMALESVKNLLSKVAVKQEEIDMIIVGTTSTTKLMPGISYYIQNKLQIKNCMCLDILAGCNGYINSFDIARNYLVLEKVKYALVVGVEALSDFTDTEDVNTDILFSDGAGATLLGRINTKKLYASRIESKGQNGEILTCKADSKIQMDGKAIYKYAVTDTVININKLLLEENEQLEDIKYIVPHQSNSRIMNKIAEKLGLPKEKLYSNIEQVGNSFCASIPIALNEMFEKSLLKSGDKVILLGYGGGLNLGSILMEV